MKVPEGKKVYFGRRKYSAGQDLPGNFNSKAVKKLEEKEKGRSPEKSTDNSSDKGFDFSSGKDKDK